MALPLLKPSEQLNTPAGHFDLLHSPAHGTAILWERSSGSHWHKLAAGDAHIPALLAAQSGQQDRYITINEFYAWRLVRHLKSLRSCYVDIDGCENLAEAQEALADAQLPQPTLAIFSGRGLHLYWIHEPVPAKALPVWQRCQDTLLAALRPLGGDPAAKDCTRVLRLAGSINSKNGQMVRGVILDPEPYGFHHLCDEVLGYRENQTEKQRKPARIVDLNTTRAKRGLTPKASIYARWALVYNDLLSIAKWYDFGGIPEGHRNNWLFLSAVSLSWFANPATLQRELESHAKTWCTGLTSGEIRSAILAPISRAEAAAAGKQFEWQGEQCDPRYKFRRETLWDWMKDIVPPELAAQLRAIVPDEIRQEHKRETDAKREATRETRDRVAEGRHESHQVGRKVDASSLAQQQPWEKLGMSRATYFRKKQAGTL